MAHKRSASAADVARHSVDVAGKGEIKTREYTQGSGDKKKTYYDADVYQVARQVKFTVDDLPLESSTERGNLDTGANTNNIINTILPFDTKNAVKWNASYLSGYSSEKRNQDVEHLRPRLEDQLLSIARAQVEQSVSRALASSAVPNPRMRDRPLVRAAATTRVSGVSWPSRSRSSLST